MRVLHVSAYFAPAFGYGGPPRSVLGLCKALERAGVTAEVYTTTANGASELPPSPAEGERYEGLRVRRFPLAWPRRVFAARGLGRALAAAAGAADLLHVHGLWNAPAWGAARTARRSGVPYVLSPRGMMDPASRAHHPRRKQLAYRLWDGRNLRRAALLHATSAAEARVLERAAPAARVAMVPNGVDAPAEWPERGGFRRRAGLHPGAPVIAFVGRLHPIKRLDLVAGAFGRVVRACPAARLVVAGPDEAGERDRVAPLFAPVSSAVRWTGPLSDEDKWALLVDADALVLCSDSESFGLVAAESLTAGTPVVATRTCPWSELEAQGCGFWVPQTPEAIADALLRLVADPARSRELGRRGRAWAERRFTWDAVAGAMVEHYARVARGRRAPEGAR